MLPPMRTGAASAFRLGSLLTASTATQSFFTSSLSGQGPNLQWCTTQRLFAKTGLDLKRCLTLVRESKRKRDDACDMSGASMANNIAFEDVQALRVAEPDLPPEDKGPKNPADALWRRKGQLGKLEEVETFSASVQVDPALLGFLIGKGGSMKEKIETDTGSSLRIPSKWESKHGKAVVVEGRSQESLDKALYQIHMVLDQAIKSPSLQYSHFISIPLALHPTLLESVIDFQKSVLESVSASSDDSGMDDKGIDNSIFVKPTTFHLTLLMLKLWNEDRVRAAMDCLQKTTLQVHEALEGSPLSIKLTGVDCMKGNPAKAHVLYADVEADDQAGRLIRASRVIADAFTEAGLVMDRDQTQTLKLHATLMNTTQRGGSGGGQGRRFKKRVPFDATAIVAKYGSHAWGEYHVSEAHLSQRFVYDENGYYHCCSSIPFP